MNNQKVCNLWQDMAAFQKGSAQNSQGISPEALFDTVLGPIRWSLVQLGFELAIFDELEQEKTAKQVATALGLHAEKTLVLLDALCSLQILLKRNDCFVLASSIAPYVLSSSEQSMRTMLLHLARSKHANINRIKDVIRSGKANHVSANFSKEDFWDKAIPNLQSFHRSLSNDVVMAILQGLPEWQQINTILDLGAGSECLAASILEQRPDAQLSLFDLPACANKIETLIPPELKEKITVIGGDYNYDSFGQGYDLIWCSMALYYAHDLNELLYRAKKALSPNGIFVSFHEGLTDHRTLPEKHVVGRFLPAINGSDVSFDQGHITQVLRAVGFSKVTSHTVNTPYGSMELDIAYQ